MTNAIYISSLTLKKFRNFKNKHIKFKQGLNAITGQVGCKKENIVNAILFLFNKHSIKKEELSVKVILVDSRKKISLERKDKNNRSEYFVNNKSVIKKEYQRIASDIFKKLTDSKQSITITNDDYMLNEAKNIIGVSKHNKDFKIISLEV